MRRAAERWSEFRPRLRNKGTKGVFDVFQEGTMTDTRLTQIFSRFAGRAIESSQLIALALIATFALLTMQPAKAQSPDTWQSIAIIGGSSAAGAYIGHKVGGSTGALVGAGVGASVGYSIDRRRRANEYHNQYAYGDGGYDGNDGGYLGNGGYYGPYDPGAYDDGGYEGGYYGNGEYYENTAAYPYRSGSSSNSCYRNSNQYSSRR
jgi:hypothetical protein